MKIAISIAATAVSVALLYHCRWLTFAIWTNAAMINRTYPKMAVGMIESAIVAALFAGFYLLTKSIVDVG